jgi:DNA gyrase inhibitor GyrI
MSSDPDWIIHLRKIEPKRAAYTHSSSETPEEDTWNKMTKWAKTRSLHTKESGTRVLGRNTYPTNNPEPHGYQLFLTIDQTIKAEDEIKIDEIPGGTYAVLSSTSIDRISEAWKSLWCWIEDTGYEFTGWIKGEYGWVNGFEERLNPFDDEPMSEFDDEPMSEWRFDLWIPLKEKSN